MQASKIELPETIAEAVRALRSGDASVRELTERCLRRIDLLQPRLNAFITVMREQALAESDRLDAELRSGNSRGPLHGIPISHKDNIGVAGVPATVGSGVFRDRIPAEDAAIVEKLRAAGAVTLGKTNMGEFGTGSAHGRNQHHGDVHNPWRLDRTPGGSSNGTAVAVSTGLCFGSTGTDALGSLRGPAARVGVVGIRVTDGRISLRGVWPRTKTLGGGGVMARTAGDVAHLLNALTGYDPEYPRSIKAPAEDFTTGLDKGVRGLTFGVIENFTFRGVDDEVASVVQAGIETFARLGASVIPVRIATLSDSEDGYRALGRVLRYEFSRVMTDLYFGTEDRKQAFGDDVHQDIVRGRRVSNLQYEAAMAYRRELSAEIRKVLGDVDALLMPTLPNLAPPQLTAHEEEAHLRLFTQPFSSAALPALTLPSGFSSDSMPVGMQVVANELQEGLLLRICAAFQRETDYHLRRPPIMNGA
jgi:aspartyl-tRNA(Asn)/glutamyl-tRNA(Gln) amidotransferase subunit A